MVALAETVEQKLLNECLLDSRDDYVERGSQLENALTRACAKGDLAEVIKILQTNNIGINVRLSERSWTPLMFAIYFNRKELFDFLLKQPRIDLSIRDYTGQTALGFALNPLSDFFKPNYDVARKLISAGAHVNEMLVMAWMTQNNDVADKLIMEFGACSDLAEAFINSDTYKNCCVNWAQTMKSSMKFTMEYAPRIPTFKPLLDSDTYKCYAGRWDEFNPHQNVITLMQKRALEKVTEQLKLKDAYPVQTSTQPEQVENSSCSSMPNIVPTSTMSNTVAIPQPAAVIFAAPSLLRERELKSKEELNFEGKIDSEIITHIVHQFNLPISECDCPAFRRDTEDNVRDYIPVLLIHELQKRSWPKEREIVITDIGAGNLKQAASIACSLVKAGYFIKFNLIDIEYYKKEESEKLMVAFAKILEILNNALSGKAHINAHAQFYEARKHTSDFLLVIDGIDRLEFFGKKGESVYQDLFKKAKAKNPDVVCVATREICFNVNVRCNDEVKKHFKYQPPKVGSQIPKMLRRSSGSE